MEDRYWPFPAKPEAAWTADDRSLVGLMRQAYADGFRPRDGQCVTFEAETPSGRSVCLVRRGRNNGWEPFLGDGVQAVRLGPVYNLPLGQNACVCVRPPFAAAAHLAIEWLHGRDLAGILSAFTFVGGRPAGIVWLPPAAVPVPVGRTTGVT